MPTTAQHKALTALTYKFPDDYRKLYLEECSKNIGNRAKAQGKAKTRLRRLHLDEYKYLYEKAAGEGYVRTHGHGSKSVKSN